MNTELNKQDADDINDRLDKHFEQDEIDKAKQKAEQFFNTKPTKTESVKDRLQSLKDQIEQPIEDTQALIPSNTVTKGDIIDTKYESLYSDLTSEQLDFIQLMIPLHFNVTNICAEVGISRNSFYRWLEENVAFKNAYDNTREYLVDKAEEVLLRSMNDMDAKTAQFVLKALTKRYKDKIDITSNGNTMGSIINVIQPNINLDNGTTS